MTAVREAPEPLRVVQEFVNTLEIESGRDELAHASGLRAWLVARGLLSEGDEVGETERSLTVEAREALRLLLLANGGEPLDPAAAETLNRTSEATGVELRFGVDGAARLEPAAHGVAGAVGTMLSVVYAAMLDGTWPRLKACRSATCRWAFYDGSKNRSAVWCTMAACGSREKARAYRARRADASGGS